MFEHIKGYEKLITKGENIFVVLKTLCRWEREVWHNLVTKDGKNQKAKFGTKVTQYRKRSAWRRTEFAQRRCLGIVESGNFGQWLNDRGWIRFRGDSTRSACDQKIA